MALGISRWSKSYARRVQTTDATVTNIFTFPVPLNGTVTLAAIVKGIRTGGSAGTANDSLDGVIAAGFNNTSGTAKQIGAANLYKFVNKDQGGWDVNFAVSGGLAVITVTGAANNNINWVADVRNVDSI